ncbi:hypothetical protein [Marisediminicola sp. LYQ134]
MNTHSLGPVSRDIVASGGALPLRSSSVRPARAAHSALALTPSAR